MDGFTHTTPIQKRREGAEGREGDRDQEVADDTLVTSFVDDWKQEPC